MSRAKNPLLLAVGCVILLCKEANPFMLKGAITIFALSVFLLSCAAQVTTTPQPSTVPLPASQSAPSPAPAPVLLPNLTILDISLSETGKIEVMLSNTGEGPAPYGIGSLTIYVDGLLKWKDSLGTLPDQSFLEPGGITLYTTPVELVGKHEVRAVLDKEEKTVEENVSSKVFPKVLGKDKSEAKLLLPDLAITDLFLTPRREVAVTIANVGESPLPLGEGNLKIMVDGSLKGSYVLRSLSDQSSLPVKRTITLTTPLVVVGRHEIDVQVGFPNEVKESSEKNNSLKKILEGPPVGPDVVVKQLELMEDLELLIILSNAGEVDLRKGAIFQVQVFVNDQKMSEFDHFISEALKANHKNRYIVAPPYQVGITGISKVKVSISPELPSDDIRLENNILQRTFIIFPFKVRPQGKEEFSFSFFAPPLRSKSQTEKVTIEAWWEWGTSALKLSFKKSGSVEGIPTLAGKSPLRVEFPIPFEEAQKESVWSIFITNLIKKRVEGHLVIQHP
jgi:archaellum component FlaG (FlaF/FlaG flagellin family)